MKIALLIVLIVTPSHAVSNQKEQPQNTPPGEYSPSGENQIGTQNRPLFVQISASPISPQESAEQEQDRKANNRRKNIEILLTIAIMLAAAAQAVGVFMQISVYKGQSELMRSALSESKRSTEAALANANAAVASVRPLLIVRIEADPKEPGTFVVRAVNEGQTPAELYRGDSVMEPHPVEGWTPTDPESPFWLPQENVITHGKGFEIIRFSPESQNRKPKDFLMSSSPELYFAYGRIEYWDMFSDRTAPGAEPYRTSWQFHYNFADKKFSRSAGPFPRNT